MCILETEIWKACQGEQQTGIIPCSTPIPVRANLGDSVQTLCIYVQEMFDTSTMVEFPCLPPAVYSGAFLTVLVCQLSAKASLVSFVSALLLLFCLPTGTTFSFTLDKRQTFVKSNRTLMILFLCSSGLSISSTSSFKYSTSKNIKFYQW